MRIINQRRNRSINFDNVEIHKDETRIYSFGNGSYSMLLGDYDTEERASEVFNEMHQFYAIERKGSLLVNYKMPTS